jgi:hypothetical protein
VTQVPPFGGNPRATAPRPGGRIFGGDRATAPTGPRGRATRGQGHQIFVDELARFAARSADERLTAVVERVAAPLRVAVRGRRGVGRDTVARALDRPDSGIVVAGHDADIDVYVITEVVKPEDAAAVAAARRPMLVVLSKADLVGPLSGGDGPVAAAKARCATLSALLGVPMEPMIGLLAVTALDDPNSGLWAALMQLAAEPGARAGLDGSFDDFLSADNPVPRGVRLRLLESLDLFGIALGVSAARQGRTPAQAATLLRRVSCVDAVIDKILALGAEARYLRVLDAVAELEALAASHRDLGDSIAGFLSRDDTVIARMASALDLAEAAGLGVDPAGIERDDPAGHLPRAVRWRRYSLGRMGPVSDLHRACGADIARGSLRLWSHACGSLPGTAGEPW